MKYAPNVADVQLSLATALCNNQQDSEAFEVLQNALKRVKTWTFFSEFPDFCHNFADLYNLLLRKSGKLDAPLLHPANLAQNKILATTGLQRVTK